ncbi:GSU2403 family nucleotidyltransferase fold protein [Methylobacterium sp. Gmos1]
MADFTDWTHEQVRQFVDAEQVLSAYQAARTELARRYAGSMAWKTVRGHQYLYRKRGTAWSSLGPRGAETEAAHAAFHDGRSRLKQRLSGLAQRLDAMAPVNRALSLGRMPVVAARALRVLAAAHLLGAGIRVVGTHALFAYERMAGLRIASGHLATGDIDLLFDARARLSLVAEALPGGDLGRDGLIGLLRSVDRSFEPTGPQSFRAVNRDGFMVDLIQPLPPDRMARNARSRIGTSPEDLSAVEIEGLAWLVNCPKVAAVTIDARGYPVGLVVPDPRAFALHKAWLATRDDRDPLKRGRDAGQARLVAGLVAARLPHLSFDDPALGAIPRALRDRAGEILPEPGEAPRSIEPDW